MNIYNVVPSKFSRHYRCAVLHPLTLRENPFVHRRQLLTGMARAATASHRQDRKRRSLEGDDLRAWLFLVVTVGVPFAVAYLPLPAFAPFDALRAICLMIFRSVQAIKIYCLVCLALHLGQGIYAWHLATKLDPANARGWFWQTFAVGFFSLRILVRRSKNQSS